MNNIVEVLDPLPQIKEVKLEENSNCYILSVSFEPRYGFGFVSRGSCYGLDDYDYIQISNLDEYASWQPETELPPDITEIRLRFPVTANFLAKERHKETEYYIFEKDSFSITKEIFKVTYQVKRINESISFWIFY